jgi:hypothetical protein
VLLQHLLADSQGSKSRRLLPMLQLRVNVPLKQSAKHFVPAHIADHLLLVVLWFHQPANECPLKPLLLPLLLLLPLPLVLDCQILLR